jgi:cysteine desulfurase/selenocysteine lyase
MNANFCSQFPALNQAVGTKSAKLIYLDSAATTLLPQVVIDAVSDFWMRHGGAAGRGTNSLANYASSRVEAVREKVKAFVGVDESYECIFTSGATEGLNMISRMLTVKKGQNIVLSSTEHHANILPWQQLALSTGVELRYLDVLASGVLDYSQLDELVDDNTVAISITHCSNVTGTATNLDSVNQHKKGAILILDCAQSVGHFPLELQKNNVDYAVFSAHKMYGPSGVGALIGKRVLLESAPVVKVGGGMVELVEEHESTFLGLPQKFEPGSVNTAGIIGFGAAVDWLTGLGWETLIKSDAFYAAKLNTLSQIDGVKVLGVQESVSLDNLEDIAVREQAPICSFTVEGIHPHDLGQFLDERGIIVRTGSHCAQLVHRQFDVLSTTRASCGVYTIPEDIDRLGDVITDAVKFFK